MVIFDNIQFFLKNFIDHPNIHIGDYTNFNDFKLPVNDVAIVAADLDSLKKINSMN